MPVLITDILGTVSNEQQITIIGSDFGANGPTIILFDDFEGANGEEIKTNYAKIGSWTSYQHFYDDQAYYTTDYKISGSTSGRFVDHEIEDEYPRLTKTGIDGFSSFYLSYWIYLPATDNWPGEGAEPSSINWKVIWVGWESPQNATDLTVPSVASTTDQYWFGNSLNNYSPPYGWSGDTPDVYPDSLNIVKGKWQRIGAWRKGRDDATGEYKMWMTRTVDNTVYEEWLNVDNLKDGTENQQTTVYLNAFMRHDHGTCRAHFDDFYFATGEYAQARVEIGNNATYANCTNMTLVTADSWSTTSIVATVRQGSFADQSTGYVFVFDSDGNVNASGYEVQFGEGSPSQSPSKLKIKTITRPQHFRKIHPKF